MSFAFTFFIALFASWLFIPYFIRHSERLGMIDHPTDDRKSHLKPISRAGGLGIILAAAVAVSFSILDVSTYILLFAAGIVIVFWGIVDDVRPMSATKKFAGQIIAVCIAMYGGVVFQDLPGINGSSPQWLNYAVTFFFLLGVTNAVNMTDGLDGLAGGSTLMSLGLIFVLSYISKAHELAIICAALMGGIAGFLRYNTHPAQVFMGDAGSQFIGFMAATLAVLCTQGSDQNYSAALPLLLLGLPILDTLYVMLVRLLHGNSPFRPDRSHLHHRLIRLNFPHHEAVGLIYLAQTVLMVLAYNLRYSDDWTIILCFILFSISLVGSMIVGKRTGWRRDQRRRTRYADKSQERRNPVFRSLGESFSTLTGLISWLVVGSIVVASVATYGSGYQDNTLGVISAIVALFLIFSIAALKNRYSNSLIRLSSGAAVAVVFYAASLAIEGSLLRYVLDGYLLILILALVVCVRITRDYLDILNNQDLLILCTLIVLPLLPIDAHSVYLAMRIAIVVYAVEYILLISQPRQLLLNYGCVAGLASLSVIMLA